MGGMVSVDGFVNRVNQTLGLVEELVSPWRDSKIFNFGMGVVSGGMKMIDGDFEESFEKILSGVFVSSGFWMAGRLSYHYHVDVSKKVVELVTPIQKADRSPQFVHPGIVRAIDYGAKGPLGKVVPERGSIPSEHMISCRNEFDFRPDGDKTVAKASYWLWAKHLIEALRWFNHTRHSIPNNIPHLFGSGYGLGMLELHNAKLTIIGKPHVSSSGPTVMPGTHPGNLLDHALLYISTYLSGEKFGVWPVSDHRLGAVLRFLCRGSYPMITVDRSKIRTPGFKEDFMHRIRNAAESRSREKDLECVNSIFIETFSHGYFYIIANIIKLKKIIFDFIQSINFTSLPRIIWASVTNGRRKPMLDSTGMALPFGMHGDGFKLKSGTAQIIEHLKETHDTVYLQGMAIDHNICPKNQPRSVAFSDEEMKSWKNKFLKWRAGILPWPQEHLSGGTATVRFGSSHRIADDLDVPALQSIVTREMLRVTQVREQIITWLHHQYRLTHDLGFLQRFGHKLSPEFWGYVEYALTLNPRLKAENFKRTESIRAITDAFTQASLTQITGTYLGSHSSTNISDFEKQLLDQLKKILNRDP